VAGFVPRRIRQLGDVSSSAPNVGDTPVWRDVGGALVLTWEPAPIGPAGAPGSVWRDGTGVPSNALGIDGDYYLDHSTGDVYLRTGGTYSVVANVKGPAGSNGTNGTNGTNGANGLTVLSGAGAPGAGLGVDGDYYIDTTAHAIYGPKTGGVWGGATSLIGPAGAAATSQSYALQGFHAVGSSAKNATYYWGDNPQAVVTTTAGIRRIYIPEAGVIKAAYVHGYAGTAGTNEAWSKYIRLNDTTDTLIATVSAAANTRIWSNTALAIAVAQGDYIEVKDVWPNFATTPLTVFSSFVCFIQPA